MELRDHDKPCEHHVLMSHEVWPDDIALRGSSLATLRREGTIWVCPGGAPVVIDYEADTIQEALETFIAWGLQNDVRTTPIEAVAVLCEVAAVLGSDS